MIGGLWRRHRWLVLAFAAALGLTVFLGARAVIFAIYWSDPSHRDEAIAGWMTPRYVAHSWQVPPQVVGEALGLEPDGAGRRATLAQIARETGHTVESLASALEAAIAAHRAEE